LGGVQVFGEVNKTTCELIVPESSYAAYKNAPQWKDFIIRIKTSSNELQNNQYNINFWRENGTVILSSKADVLSVDVFGTNGQIIKHIDNLDKKSISIIDKHGVFILKVQFVNGTLKTIKVIN